MKKLLILIPMILSLSGCVVVVTNPDSSVQSQDTNVLTTAVDDLNNTLERLIATLNRYR